MSISSEQLVEQAIRARQHAYAPYSNYQVGAALLTADGQVVVGCNVENAAYPATICAERVALTSAIARGLRSFSAMAVATRNGGSPCGTCRQVMAELGPEMRVLIANSEGEFFETTVKELLPASFQKSNVLDS